MEQINHLEYRVTPFQFENLKENFFYQWVRDNKITVSIYYIQEEDASYKNGVFQGNGTTQMVKIAFADKEQAMHFKLVFGGE